jgi:Domain of unknown function (DUF3291)
MLEKEQTNRRRLALYTFGIFRERSDHPVNQGFHDRNDGNLRAVALSEGFIARSGYLGDPGPASWGAQVFPRFYVERGDGWSPSTLSLWENLVAPMAFSYGGLHAEALRHGREWFHKPVWPPYVLWWVAHDHTPSWTEAVAKHEYLHDHGISAAAFDFKNPFDEDARPTTIDRESLQRTIWLNEQRQRASGFESG